MAASFSFDHFGLFGLVGLSFEERDLLRDLGARYAQYRREVPMLVPWPRAPKSGRKQG